MHLVQAECTQEHKSQFEMNFMRSLKGQEMKIMSILCTIWPIWPDLRNRLTLKLILMTEKTDQMLTWRVLGVVYHSLQFDFMN